MYESETHTHTHIYIYIMTSRNEFFLLDKKYL
jgi:hypothetical protein